MDTSGVQNGIQDGDFQVDADFQIDGVSYPFLTLNVDLNAYAVAGMITASLPIAIADPVTGRTTQPDISALAAANPYLPIKVRVGYADASTTPGAAPLFDLEWGILDDTTDSYDLDMLDVTGRAVAAVFQDTQITGAAMFRQAGSDLATAYFSKAKALAPKLVQTSTVVPSQPGSNPVGKVGETETQFLKASRSRSMWDELQDAAIQDAYILRTHNGNFYYGPPPADNAVPIVNLRWIGSKRLLETVLRAG